MIQRGLPQKALKGLERALSLYPKLISFKLTLGAATFRADAQAHYFLLGH